jgi:hypothetical protein
MSSIHLACGVIAIRVYTRIGIALNPFQMIGLLPGRECNIGAGRLSRSIATETG